MPHAPCSASSAPEGLPWCHCSRMPLAQCQQPGLKQSEACITGCMQCTGLQGGSPGNAPQAVHQLLLGLADALHAHIIHGSLRAGIPGRQMRGLGVWAGSQDLHAR